MIGDIAHSEARSAAHASAAARQHVDLGVRPERFDLHKLFAMVALAGTFLGVIVLFAVSPIMLEARGISYIEPGGGLIGKFHPATLIAIAALVFRCIASKRPLKVASRLLTDDSGVLLLLAATAIAALCAGLVDKTPVTPLVDTFILPIVVFLLLRDLDPTLCRWLAGLISIVLIANAMLAIVEFLRNWHLIQVPVPPGATDDPTQANGVFSWTVDQALDWRAEALLGHPLVNGLVIGGFVLCLIARGADWIPSVLRVPLVLLQSASMLTFGARAPLVLMVVFGAWLVFSRIVAAIRDGRRASPRLIAAAMAAVAIAIVAALIIVQTGFAEKTIERFSDDAGSAKTRVTMFSLFAPVPLHQLILGPDKDLIATLQRVYGLEFGIESSWIGLILTYGFVIAAIVGTGLLAFFRTLARVSGDGAALIIAYFVVLVSVTASLSGKTTSLAMEVALVMLFLRVKRPSIEWSTSRRPTSGSTP